MTIISKCNSLKKIEIETDGYWLLNTEDQIKAIRKTTAVLHYTIFDTKMSVNSGALSLLRNIFRTCLVSMATSRLICISANALKLFLPIDA